MLSHSFVSDSWQPIRLLCPWDSPDKNTGMDRNSLLQGESSQPRDRIQVSRIAGKFFTIYVKEDDFPLSFP